MFGWTNEDNPELGLITKRRILARTTIVSIDADRDGMIDGQAFFSWFTPAKGTYTNYREMREDRNHDGKWDTWLINLEDKTKFQVDLTGDEKADWEFESSDSSAAYAKIKARRGY